MPVHEPFGSVNYTVLSEHFHLHKEQNVINQIQNSVSELLDGGCYVIRILKAEVKMKLAL